MTPKELQIEVEKEANEALASCDSITIVSLDPSGFPRAATVTKAKADSFREIYIETSVNSHKAKNFRVNDKASISYYARSGGATLIGRIEVVEDLETKLAVWQPGRHFKNPKAPNYCVLRFTTLEATFCVGEHFRSYKYKDKRA